MYSLRLLCLLAPYGAQERDLDYWEHFILVCWCFCAARQLHKPKRQFTVGLNTTFFLSLKAMVTEKQRYSLEIMRVEPRLLLSQSLQQRFFLLCALYCVGSMFVELWPSAILRKVVRKMHILDVFSSRKWNRYESKWSEPITMLCSELWFLLPQNL